MKKFILLVSVLFVALTASAQHNYGADYQKFKQQRVREYLDYRAQANKQFVEFLKKQWKDYTVNQAKEAPLPVVRPRPDVAPKTRPIPLPEVTPDFGRLRDLSKLSLTPRHDFKPTPRPHRESGIRPAPRPKAEVTPRPAPKPRPESDLAQRPSPRPRPEVAPRPAPRPGVAPRPVTPSKRPDAPAPQPARPEIPARPDRPALPAPRPDIPEPPTRPTPDRTVVPEHPAPEIIPMPERPSTTQHLEVSFFGDRIEMPWREDLTPRMSTVSEQSFSKLWSQWSTMDETQIDFLNDFVQDHRLNGWGCYQLIKRLSEAAYTDEHCSSERIALQAFLLAQLKYRAQVGLCKDQLVLLLPFRQKVYGIPYLDLNGTKHYIFGYNYEKRAGFQTYDNNVPYATELLDLSLDKHMNTGMTQSMKFARMSKLLGEELQAELNVGEVALMLSLPMLDGEVYYAQEVDAALAKRVLSVLHRKIAGKSETDAVSYLLNFVQNGFDYATDQEMFGRQKQLFIEESFYYGKNNCKDRVGVFSWLVRELLGLDMISITYEGNAQSNGVGHITCAVCFTKPVQGDTFTYKGRKYVMCDPTYINAKIGMTMPCFKNSQGEVHAL